MITKIQAAIYADCAEEMVDGTLTPPLDPRCGELWDLVGYLTAVNAGLLIRLLGGGERVYFGFVARSKEDPEQHIVVIRGTEPKAIIEWIENFTAIPHRVGGWTVPLGFWELSESMEFNGAPAAQAIDQALLNAAQITVIGHSLGGALGTYLLHKLATRRRNNSVHGMLFAAPRAGDAIFAADVDKVVGSLNYTVYNYIRDVVPRCPPGYATLSNAEWIQPATALASIRNDPLCNHHATSYAAMLGAQLQSECIIGDTP